MVAIGLLDKKTDESERWLTPDEEAAILNVSDKTVYRRIRDKSLPARHEGKRLYRIRKSDLDTYIQKGIIESEQ